MQDDATAKILPRREEYESAIMALRGQSVGPKLIQRLRRDFGDDLAHLLISVASLQTKASLKLGQAEHVWWVTERSLQQATPWQVARHKATWLGNRNVHDLCCGIGGDTISLAQRGLTIAVDADPIICEMAAANLSNVGLQPTVRCHDVAQMQVPAGDAIHIDPDRRVHSTRSTDPARYSPTWDQVIQLLSHVDSGVVKLAPAAEISCSELASLGATHRCWISHRGSVREQSLLIGEAIELASAPGGGRSAISVDIDGNSMGFSPTTVAVEAPVANQPMSFMIDPDPAIRAAGLTTTFALEHELQVLGSPSGFLTSDKNLSDRSMARAESVIWSGSTDDRKLRQELKQRNVHPVTAKVRGLDLDPATLVKRYRKCGEHPVTLWMGRTGKTAYAALTTVN